MSERFYFNIDNGTETICDEEGVGAESLEEALEEARSVISEMVDEVAEDRPGELWMLTIRDTVGSLVGRLPIKK